MRNWTALCLMLSMPERGVAVPLSFPLTLLSRAIHMTKTVAASMKRQGLVAKAAKKFKATTDSDHDLPVAPNLLDQDFSADAPNQKWVCDITYLCARLPVLAWRCPPGHEHVRNTYGQSKEAIWSIWPLFAAKEREPKRR